MADMRCSRCQALVTEQELAAGRGAALGTMVMCAKCLTPAGKDPERNRKSRRDPGNPAGNEAFAEPIPARRPWTISGKSFQLFAPALFPRAPNQCFVPVHILKEMLLL